MTQNAIKVTKVSSYSSHQSKVKNHKLEPNQAIHLKDPSLKNDSLTNQIWLLLSSNTIPLRSGLFL